MRSRQRRQGRWPVGLLASHHQITTGEIGPPQNSPVQPGSWGEGLNDDRPLKISSREIHIGQVRIAESRPLELSSTEVGPCEISPLQVAAA